MISYKHISKNITEVGTNEDGEVYYVIGNITKEQAFKAFRHYEKVECGLSKEELASEENMDVEMSNFWEGADGNLYWRSPLEPSKPLGIGWIGTI